MSISPIDPPADSNAQIDRVQVPRAATEPPNELPQVPDETQRPPSAEPSNDVPDASQTNQDQLIRAGVLPDDPNSVADLPDPIDTSALQVHASAREGEPLAQAIEARDIAASAATPPERAIDPESQQTIGSLSGPHGSQTPAANSVGAFLAGASGAAGSGEAADTSGGNVGRDDEVASPPETVARVSSADAAAIGLPRPSPDR